LNSWETNTYIQANRWSESLLTCKEVTNGETAFMDPRKFNYNINVRSEMKELGAEVLAGRAKTVSARHYLLNELDLLAEQYGKAWMKYTGL
jgi:hypothetical protein